ncbi:Na(+)/H(+) antiporter subunit F1 [Cytobacillus praedii]|jgi:multicomponent Na+:H+ antiporter subunit F|uniref:Na(+)/H(+) antiporter subunit F1 n=1 Tax=Cytobacillus praedii TaxID=1742358 RepID=A0A4R1B4N2_9BACI|nr:Na(+)/H(+) antiporter subunit F1 [Cytobacillus praedii]MED3552766.1 Na(+)/H(+) antiporter subunit F1 [Cytobacillus praedii]MED3573966.1 Na(+)/H(+) antiporter subunit F1 [Cytobacillus praedii]TCJ05649.1 Na(+)/H(+) antiporter subunit F1 [Cytobacillus praedii]
MFKLFLMGCLFFITLAIIAALYRVVKGPSKPDRVMALDNIGINLLAGVAILSILLHTHAFLDIILLLGILSFVGTIAFARYIERGVVIERKHIE